MKLQLRNIDFDNTIFNQPNTIESLIIRTTAEELLNKINYLLNSNTPYNLNIGIELEYYLYKHLNIHLNLFLIDNSNIKCYKTNLTINRSDYSITFL